MSATQPWNTPVNILDADANQQIRDLGQQAMDLMAFTLICNEHGEFKWNVPEGKIDIETTRHRLGEACWHGIEAVQAKK